MEPGQEARLKISSLCSGVGKPSKSWSKTVQNPSAEICRRNSPGQISCKLRKRADSGNGRHDVNGNAGR